MSAMYTQTPAPGASGMFTNSEKLPSPRSGYGSREIPDLWNAPVQGITISESSQLSSGSQLGRSHPVSPLRSQIALTQSRDCANVLRNLEIAQFPDSKNAQRNLEIAQIPKLRGTHTYAANEIRVVPTQTQPTGIHVNSLRQNTYKNTSISSSSLSINSISLLFSVRLCSI